MSKIFFISKISQNAVWIVLVSLLTWSSISWAFLQPVIFPNVLSTINLHNGLTDSLMRTHASASSMNLEISDLSKIFYRIADKNILLDIPEAGLPELTNCCHSGCDNCAYSRVFDSLSSARAKWVALYSYREFVDKRFHEPIWTSLFREKNDANMQSISKVDFINRLKILPVQFCLGPPSLPLGEPPIPSDESLTLFWEILFRENPNCNDNLTISADEFAAALKSITVEEHGATWQSFLKAFKATAS